jgi:hypothetical protein
MGKIMAMTDDVQRLFRRLVEVLAARGEDRILDPIDLADLYQKIIPYRAHRAALRFDTNEDYEMALLKLLAGEQGFVEVEPAEVAQALAEEAQSINPNPGAFRSFGQARARLSFRAVKQILEAATAYAPPDATDAMPTPPKVANRAKQLPFDLEPVPPPSPPAPAGASQPLVPEVCPQCSKRLPAGRAISFCPHCGGSVKLRDCPECGTQLELDWRHCVTCGYRVT